MQIGPRRIIDLEEIVSRDAIEKSQDLRIAFRSKLLALTRHSIIHTDAKPQASPQPQVVEKIVEKSVFDEKHLIRLVKEAVAEELHSQPKQEMNLAETVRSAVATSVGDLVSSIRSQINAVNIAPVPGTVQHTIAPEKLAEISQQTIQKISDKIETGGTGKTKTINITNKRNVSDLANELS